MAEKSQATKPVLQRPPGYRDSNVPVKPVARRVRAPIVYQPKRTRRSCCRLCCCCLCITIAVLVALTVLFGAVFYLLFDPKPPVFHLQSFKLSTFNVTKKPDGTYLYADLTARVEVHNPNSKLKYQFGRSEITMTVGPKGSDDETELGSLINVDGFSQAEKNTTNVKIVNSVKNQVVADGIGPKLESEYNRKTLVINVEMKTSVGVGLGNLKVGKLRVDVYCNGVTLKKLDGDAMPRCTVNTLKWITIH